MQKEEFEKLKKKHGILPSFEALNSDFGIEAADRCSITQIKKKMAEKFELILENMEHILQPIPESLSDMLELKAFTEGEKKTIFETFRKLMYHYRAFLEGDLLDDKQNVRIIRAAFDEWQKQKTTMQPIFKKLKECWEKEVETREILTYLG